MNKFVKVVAAAVIALGLLVVPVAAQTVDVRLWPNGNVGDVTADDQAVQVTNARGMGTAMVQVDGTFSGALALQCTAAQSSATAPTWVTVPMRTITDDGAATVTSVTGTGAWIGSIPGCAQVRVVGSSWVSGTASVTVNTVQTGGAAGSSAAVTLEGGVTVSDVEITAIAAGDNNIGNVDVASIGAGNNNIGDVDVASIAAGDNNIGNVDVVTLPALPSGSNTIGTVNLSATDNAVLDDIADGITVTVTGGATAANQTTVIGHVDGVETLLGTANTSLGSLDNAVGAVTGGVQGTSSLLAGGVYNLSPPTLTDGDQAALQFDVNGNLKTALVGSIEADLEVGAQPAADPHYVRCSDGSIAGACVVSATNLDVQSGGADLATAAQLTTLDGRVDGLETLIGTTNTSLTTIDGRVDGIEGLLGTSNTNTGNSVTSLQTIDNIVAVEDAVAGSAFSGVPILAVRQDVQSDLAADGDFIPLTVDGDGLLRVTVGGGSGGTALADDADFTAGTTVFTPTGGFYQSTVTACTDGDTCAVGITAQRTLKATLYTSAGVELTAADVVEDTASAGAESGPVVMAVRRDTAASSSGTDGDFSTLNTDASGRLWVNCGTGCSGGTQYAEDAAHASGDTGTLALAVRRNTASAGSGADGDNSTLNVDTNGKLWVNAEVTTMPTVTVTATNLDVQSGGADMATAAAQTTTNTLLTNLGKTEDAAHASGDVGVAILAKRTDTPAASGADGDYVTLNSDATGRLHVQTGDPCSYGTKVFVAINQTTSTQLFTGTASNRIYVCSITLTTAAAQNIALVNGTGTVCATGIAGMIGGTSAATGMQLAANGGFAFGAGAGTVAKSTADAANVCLLQSGANQVSGVISYVVAAN